MMEKYMTCRCECVYLIGLLQPAFLLFAIKDQGVPSVCQLPESRSNLRFSCATVRQKLPPFLKNTKTSVQ